MALGRWSAGGLGVGMRAPLPWIVLAIGLAAAVLSWQALWRDAVRAAGNEFQRSADSAGAALRARVQAYEQMLVAGAALVASSSGDVTRAQWGKFVERLKLDRYPAIQSLGYAERVRRADRERHVSRMRAEGLADYDIRPPGERDEQVVIAYSEPYKGRNARVVGLDVLTQPVLRAAIVRTLESGAAAVTEKVVVPVDDAAGGERSVPGFVMYVPVFRPGMPTGTPQERDAAAQGFVFATFRAAELAADVLDPTLARSVEATLYDGAPAPESLYAASGKGAGNPAVFRREAAVDVGGRRWTAVLSSTPEFESRAQEAIPLGVLATGGAMVLALFVLSALLVAARRQRVDTTMRDALTQLHNDAYLDEAMTLELPRARRAGQGVGLVLLDIDNFKAVQDKGRPCAEHVLRQFARLMEEHTRETDIKCRYAGSQFALAMPGASIENARVRAERLREVLEAAAMECDGKPVGPLTLSAGVAAFPQHGEHWSNIVQAAHRALYAAKSAGRNRVAIAE